jgi:hypothetical protein
MSVSSRPKKVKPKGVIQELKLVQTISRNGKDTVQTEAIKTPSRPQQKAAFSNTPSQSCSPTKRRKLEDFEEELTAYDMGDSHMSAKRKTLVFLFPLHCQPFLIIYRAKMTFFTSL